jgi:hypothetical protein
VGGPLFSVDESGNAAGLGGGLTGINDFLFQSTLFRVLFRQRSLKGGFAMSFAKLYIFYGGVILLQESQYFVIGSSGIKGHSTGSSSLNNKHTRISHF